MIKNEKGEIKENRKKRLHGSTCQALAVRYKKKKKKTFFSPFFTLVFAACIRRRCVGNRGRFLRESGAAAIAATGGTGSAVGAICSALTLLRTVDNALSRNLIKGVELRLHVAGGCFLLLSSVGSPVCAESVFLEREPNGRRKIGKEQGN